MPWSCSISRTGSVTRSPKSTQPLLRFKASYAANTRATSSAFSPAIRAAESADRRTISRARASYLRGSTTFVLRARDCGQDVDDVLRRVLEIPVMLQREGLGTPAPGA